MALPCNALFFMRMAIGPSWAKYDGKGSIALLELDVGGAKFTGATHMSPGVQSTWSLSRKGDVLAHGDLHGSKDPMFWAACRHAGSYRVLKALLTRAGRGLPDPIVRCERIFVADHRFDTFILMLTSTLSKGVEWAVLDALNHVVAGGTETLQRDAFATGWDTALRLGRTA